MNIRLLRPIRPVYIYENSIHYYDTGHDRGRIGSRLETKLQISSGLTFDDGDQLLVSAQKPLGIVLEERTIVGNEDDPKITNMGCIVIEVVAGGVAEKAGVREGDYLVAVQNVDVGFASFEEVMKRIADAPKVVNLRFWRKEW